MLRLSVYIAEDITKTCLFKYTENFTTKKFQMNILIFFMFLLKT